MKSSADPRHVKRIRLAQQLFAASFKNRPVAAVKPIWENLSTIDPLIAAAAPEWPLDKLNHIDLAILRLAVYELVIDKKEPLKVIIDEAIELAKEFGAENSPSFINGALGTIIKDFDTK